MGSTLLSTVLFSLFQLLRWFGMYWSPHDPRQMCYQKAGHGKAGGAQNENLGLDLCVHA